MDCRDESAGQPQDRFAKGALEAHEHANSKQSLEREKSSEQRSDDAACARLDSASQRRFRLWITSYADWRPQRWNDAPPVARAIEPADAATHSAQEAQFFLEGFNSQMLSGDRQVWAVAIPVELRYEGDPRPGDVVRGYEFAAGDA